MDKKKSIINHIMLCLILLIMLPYFVIKFFFVIYVLIDAPPNYEGEPRKSDVLTEVTQYIKSIVKECYQMIKL